MIAVVAILLIFGVVVRYKWRTASAEKEEILRLVARVSEEEAEIEKLQAVEEYNSPPPTPPPPSQLERRYFCVVCHCPTTTRCSQCKAVRYCSGKCQIIHWRQGHKDDCRPVTSMDDSKGSKAVEETNWDNRFDNDEAKGGCDPAQEVDDSGSSSCSLPCFSSSTERSETSFDTSVSEGVGSGTSIRTDKVDSDSHLPQTTSGSDEAGLPSMLAPNSASNKLKKTSASKSDEGFLSAASFKDKRAEGGSSKLEEIVVRAAELRSSQYSSSLKGSSTENLKSQVQPSSDTAMNFNRRASHIQVLNGELRTSQCSKSLSTSSNEYRKNEAKMFSNKETRSMSVRNSANAQKASIKNGGQHTSLSECDSVRLLSQSPSKGLKTSVRKFVQHFRVSKQSKSYTYDTGEDFAGNYNHKIIFPPKLFLQLYSCDGLELHPFGLLNCGNSCYANAVLQCLTFTRPIASYLLQGLHSRTCRKRNWCFICEFEHLIQKGCENKSPFSPVGILSHIQRIGSHLSHGREEDAHDFLRNVVETMQSIWLEEAGVSGSLGENSTLMGLTFGGYLRSKIKCMKCLGRSEQCERMMDLTVEIDGDIHTLEEALARFTISETLSGDDKYKCCRCKSYEKAKKKLTVLEAPNVLTIVLKRFRSGNLEKLNKLVQFPEILNLAPYVSGVGDKCPIYGLYAVVVHLNTMNAAYSGHYISYVKDFQGEWFRIDDSRVSHVDLEAVLSSEAYVLFYARHTPRIPSLLANSSSVHCDGKTKRNIEAVPASTGAKKKNSKPKPTTRRLPPNGFTSNHTMTSEDWGGYHSKLQNPLVDWSSDTSSIFSASDAGSTSTDSTKDSSVEDISGYIFGSSLYPR